jgi:endogenous inhibitor of DNA gyrase (YacG/DUF329 family)
MSIPATVWRTDDPCPACGTALTLTDTAKGTIRQDCPACGRSVIWDGGADD